MQRAAVDMDTVGEAAPGSPTYTADEAHFVEALRAGDELAFVALIDRYQSGMVRLARVFVRDASVAEEVVQEAWLAVLRGLAKVVSGGQTLILGNFSTLGLGLQDPFQVFAKLGVNTRVELTAELARVTA